MTDTSNGVILIVDDEPIKRVTLQIELTEAGYTALEAPGGAEALALLASRHVDAVVSDVRMPDMSGLELLERVKLTSPGTPVLLMTAYGSIDDAVEAIKRGAADYITKPFTVETLTEKLTRQSAMRNCAAQPGTGHDRLGSLVGRSHAARQMFERIRQLAAGSAPVVIEGEPGSGKDTVASAILALSDRAQRGFLRVSCAAGSGHDLESRLFGTPASSNGNREADRGALEAASGGTLLLEQLELMPPEIQVRFRQVLRDRVITIPGREPVQLDVRLLATCQGQLSDHVGSGRLREDLYYQLGGATITVPPLRDRREDIPLLAGHFLVSAAREIGNAGTANGFHPHALDALMSHHWPGNLSELRQVVQRAALQAPGREITPADLSLPRPARGDGEESRRSGGIPLPETVACVERKLIDTALRQAAGNQAKAAQFLGIPRTTLRDKMTKYRMVGDGDGAQPAPPA